MVANEEDVAYEVRSFSVPKGALRIGIGHLTPPIPCQRFKHSLKSGGKDEEEPWGVCFGSASVLSAGKLCLCLDPDGRGGDVHQHRVTVLPRGRRGTQPVG